MHSLHYHQVSQHANLPNVKMCVYDNMLNIHGTYESATTILVLVTFSMVNLVFPPLPATRPIARDR